MKFEDHFIRASLLVLGVCCEWTTRGQRYPSLLSGTSWLKMCPMFSWPQWVCKFKVPRKSGMSAYLKSTKLFAMRACSRPPHYSFMLQHPSTSRIQCTVYLSCINEMQHRTNVTLQKNVGIERATSRCEQFHVGRRKPPSLRDCRMCLRK